ncbi:alpha-L-rhamnosidase C-terminal domain-containing protein [Streptomyces geysiriensis]|uniref:alpha-L-rhamnosidase C-terminal domain-containing protein n=1 Tax=Streptomyces geysiriensis TaxID=68207 RepID=UPI0027E0C4CD|nr:alpha-L-rhamnosidase C-terminal domain-containing protein [Streptomyces geysiriensis]
MPVLALPGDDGRDHDLGALVLDAARRLGQPGRDDQLQPLRPGCRGGLALQGGGRDPAGRAGLCAYPPRPDTGLDWAGASLQTPHGRVECHWRRDGSAIEVRALVPDGVEADVLLPDGTERTVTGGEHTFRS